MIMPDQSPNFSEYTITVNGNDGEQQLIIVHSYGQDGFLRLAVVKASCDGGLETYPVAKVQRARFAYWLMDTLAAWAKEGSPIPEYESEKVSLRLRILHERIRAHVGM